MITVVETPRFQKDADKLLTDDEREDFIDFIARQPTKGDLIRGTGGLRKARWGIRGSGKSGGARIVYYYHDDDVPLFLITVFEKSKKSSLTKAERQKIKGLGKALAKAYGK